MIEDLAHIAGLHDLTGIHHGHPVTDLCHHTEVVGNQQNTALQLLLQLFQQLQHLGPDYAITVDVGFAAETRDLNPSTTRVTMGKGASIQLYDWCTGSFLGIIVPRKVSDALEAAAQHAGVSYQTHVNLNGGTDAGEMSLSNGGVLTGSIALPERYMHTTVGTVDVRDVASAGAMLAQFVLDLDKADS